MAVALSVGDGDTGRSVWREIFGMRVLVDERGKEIARVWGLRSNAPWHASVGGQHLGTFMLLDDALAAVEAMVARRR